MPSVSKTEFPSRAVGALSDGISVQREAVAFYVNIPGAVVRIPGIIKCSHLVLIRRSIAKYV